MSSTAVDLTSLEGFEAFDIIGVDDVFTIGAIKYFIVQFFFEITEVAFFCEVFSILFVYEEDQFMFGEEQTTSSTLRFETHSSFYEDARFLFFLVIEIVVERGMVIDEMALETLVFFYGAAQFVLAKGFIR